MPPKSQRFEERQYMRSNTYEVFHYKDAAPKEVALHHHDFYEIYFFLSGNVQYNIESRSYLLTPGDVLLISPLELHQPMFSQDQRSYERIVLWINRRFLEGLSTPGQNLAACFDATQPGHTNLLRPDGNTRQLLSYQLDMLRQETGSDAPFQDIYALSCLVQVLIQLNRLSLREQRGTESTAPSDSVVYSVLNYINDHYRDDLSLDFLANKFFISKYHLSREFNRLIGTSVHRYVIQKRLVMAKQMMTEGVSSSEVYQHCGFGDYSNFYRAFKAEYEISPKEFTARLKPGPSHRDPLRRRLWEHTED